MENFNTLTLHSSQIWLYGDTLLTATARGVVAVVVVITVIHALLDINQPGAMRFIPEYVRYSFSNRSRGKERHKHDSKKRESIVLLDAFLISASNIKCIGEWNL